MKIGILGGSGLYAMESIADLHEEEVKTPFGRPSGPFACGTLEGVEVCFLARHGKGHRIIPSELNHKANICGMKMLEVERVISISAVGSLKEEYRPGDILLPDQYFDRTKAAGRSTFFGAGIVAHISFADPTCDDMRQAMGSTIADFVVGEGLDVQVYDSGTYVNMEGPAFSTRAESNAYRQMGFDVIGMTSLLEAKLCREAELCYQSIAMVTDYDCWRETEEAVNVEMLIKVLMGNTELAKRMLGKLVNCVAGARSCTCGSALATAIITQPDAIPDVAKQALKPIIGKYIS